MRAASYAALFPLEHYTQLAGQKFHATSRRQGSPQPQSIPFQEIMIQSPNRLTRQPDVGYSASSCRETRAGSLWPSGRHGLLSIRGLATSRAC